MNKSINCLMLKMPDDRKFFTSQTNFSQLVEFARTCDAEISVVKARDVKVLELEELARSVCNHGRHVETTEYELVEMKTISPDEVNVARTRKKLLTQANIISSTVKDAFLRGEVVSLCGLENQYSEFGLSKAALCNHIARVKKELADEGHVIVKVQRGQYRVVACPSEKVSSPKLNNDDGHIEATYTRSQQELDTH